MKFSSIIRMFSEQKYIDQYRKLSIQDRQKRFNKIKTAFLIGHVIAGVILIASFAIPFAATFLAETMMVKFFWMVLTLWCLFQCAKGLNFTFRSIQFMVEATGYTNLNADVFTDAYARWGENAPAIIKEMASHIKVEADDFEEKLKADCKEGAEIYTVLDHGDVIGKIENSDILEFVRMQNKETGEIKVLKYAGYHATDALAEFRRIAPPGSVGYIMNKVIYLSFETKAPGMNQD